MYSIYELLIGLRNGNMYFCRYGNCKKAKWKEYEPDVVFDSFMDFINSGLENKKFFVWYDENENFCVKYR